MLALQIMLSDGEGVEKNEAEAEYWRTITEGAPRGVPQPQF